MISKDIIIVGGGPAGVAAAIQLKRTGWNPIIFEKNRLGGLLNNANLVENYPGFPQGITGPALISRFIKQLDILRIKIVRQSVHKLDYVKNEFIAATEKGEWRSKAAIVASGTYPRNDRKIKISKVIKDRVYYEIAGLRKIRKKDIAIIGAGDAAFDYALNMAQRNRVKILNRGSDYKCLPLLYKKAVKNGAIGYRCNITVTKILEADNNQLMLSCSKSGRELDIRADYVILAIGRKTERGFIGERLKSRVKTLRKDGLIYFVGDVAGGIYRQSSIAIGDGIKAAMKLDRRLRGFPV